MQAGSQASQYLSILCEPRFLVVSGRLAGSLAGRLTSFTIAFIMLVSQDFRLSALGSQVGTQVRSQASQ